MKRLALLAFALLPAPALAQPAPDAVTVELSNFAFTPKRIELVHGRRYTLHLVSAVGGGHNFDAEQFFAAATIDPADQAKIRAGKIEVSGRQTVDISFTAPAPGTYQLHCSHFGHTVLGMSGQIVVH